MKKRLSGHSFRLALYVIVFAVFVVLVALFFYQRGIIHRAYVGCVRATTSEGTTTAEDTAATSNDECFSLVLGSDGLMLKSSDGNTVDPAKLFFDKIADKKGYQIIKTGNTSYDIISPSQSVAEVTFNENDPVVHVSQENGGLYYINDQGKQVFVSVAKSEAFTNLEVANNGQTLIYTDKSGTSHSVNIGVRGVSSLTISGTTLYFTNENGTVNTVELPYLAAVSDSSLSYDGAKQTITFTNATGTTVVPITDLETSTKMVNNGNGTYTFTNEDGEQTTFGAGGDTLATLTCTNGQIAKFDGTNWVCAADGPTDAFVQNGNAFGNLATIGTNDDNALALKANGDEKMRILPNGNIGIGTATPGSPLEVSSAGTASSLTIAGFYAPNNTTVGRASQISFGTSNSTGNNAELRYMFAGDNSAANRVDFGFNGYSTPALTYTRSGSVGIGTTTPSGLLQVGGTYNVQIDNGAYVGNPRIVANTSPTGGLYFEPSNGYTIFNGPANTMTQFQIQSSGTATKSGTFRAFNDTASSNAPFLFYTDGPGTNKAGDILLYAGVEIGDITKRTSGNYSVVLSPTGTGSVNVPNGNVGVGTGSPATKLQVVGDIRVGDSGTNGCLQRFDGTGLVGTCTSDQRLKQNIVALSQNEQEPFSYLDKITRLQPVTYQWNEDAAKLYGKSTDTTVIGLTAQDVERDMPELVTTDAHGYKQADFTSLNFYVLQALKELNQKVEQKREKTVYANGVTFEQFINVHGDMYLGGHLHASGDTTGTATMGKGQRYTKVQFYESYQSVPNITVTPLDTFTQFAVIEKSTDGFTIAIPADASQTIRFDWHALERQGQ